MESQIHKLTNETVQKFSPAKILSEQGKPSREGEENVLFIFSLFNFFLRNILEMSLSFTFIFFLFFFQFYIFSFD